MAVGDTYEFPGFLRSVLTQLFFPKPPTTFLTCFCRGERRKYSGEKSCLNRGSISQRPGQESDMLTTELGSTDLVQTFLPYNPEFKQLWGGSFFFFPKTLSFYFMLSCKIS